MIPEYKLYHGAVLAEIVHELNVPVTIDELNESGRLSSYILNETIGLHVKHSSQRLTPWSFTFTRQNMLEAASLVTTCDEVFVVCVCETQGMVCLSLAEIMQIIDVSDTEQAWIRIDRRRGKWFNVHGGLGALKSKKPNGLVQLLRKLQSDAIAPGDDNAGAG